MMFSVLWEVRCTFILTHVKGPAGKVKTDTVLVVCHLSTVAPGDKVTETKVAHK